MAPLLHCGWRGKIGRKCGLAARKVRKSRCAMPDYDDEMTDCAVREYLSEGNRHENGDPEQPDREATRRDGNQITVANASGTLATYRIIGNGDAACVRRVRPVTVKGTPINPAPPALRRSPSSRC